MIPQEKSEAVARGLRAAFGVAEFEDIRRITKGRTTALVFRILVEGLPYLLRLTPPNRMLGPERQFTCMKAAAEAGLAPRVWYTSFEDHLAITDFVEESPFPAKDARARMPAVLRALHALPPFPRGVDHLDTTCLFLMHPGPAVDGFLQKAQAANLVSPTEFDELLEWRAQLAAVNWCDESNLVSSHNDLFKPDNILFDGSRVWLVDWEAAFFNDRYADLAVVANLLVSNDAEERAYLQEYFGRTPNEYERARFCLMQQLVHMFYALAFLWMGSVGKPVDWSEKAPEFQTFQRRFWEGEIRLEDNETKVIYGKLHWQRLVENRQQGRFQEALRIVSDRQECA